MDTFSAIPLAATIIKFVDFGRSLLQDTVELYQSDDGRGSRTLNISMIAQELVTLSNEVESQAGIALGSIKVGEGSEAIFLQLCKTCQEIAQELQGCVTDVKGYIASKPRRAVRSFRKALQQRRSKEKIEALLAQMNQVQQRMMTSLLVFFW